MGAPSPRCTAEFKQEAVVLYGKSGTTYAEVARGLDCDAGACPTGSRRPTRPIADGRRPVPDGRGPAQAQARERAAEEGEVQVHFPQRRQAAGLGDVRRARGDPPGPLRAEGPAAERARDARRGARRIDHPGQKRGARHIRRAQDLLHAEADGAASRARAPSAPRARSAQPGEGSVEDLVKRKFSADGPNMARFADITCVKTRQGRLHPAPVMDIWSRRIVGWAMGPGITAELADEALKMALARRNNPRGCVHHSDHGAQYVSLLLSKTVRERGVRPSMGSISSPWDNAAMGSPMGIVKSECVRAGLRRARGGRAGHLRVHQGGAQPGEDPLDAGLHEPGRV